MTTTPMAPAWWARIQRAWSLRSTMATFYPDRGYTACLDGLRAIAVMTVVGQHTMYRGLPPGFTAAIRGGAPDAAAVARHENWALVREWNLSWASAPWKAGDIGVDVFFVLSGFLMALMWLNEVQRRGRFDHVRYAVRRWLRLWPALFCAWAASEAAYFAIGWHAMAHKCLRQSWTILLFLHNLVPDDDGQTGLKCLHQTWTLSVEVQLLLATPVIMFAVWSPTAMAPRKFGGRAALFALSTVGIWVRLARVLTQPKDDMGFFRPMGYDMLAQGGQTYVAGMAACITVFQVRRARVAAAERGAGAAPDVKAESVIHDSAAAVAADDPPASVASGDAAPPATAPADVEVGPHAPPSPPPSLTARLRQALTSPPAAAAAMRAADVGALLAFLALVYAGAGTNPRLWLVAPTLSSELDVAAHWAAGWAVARVVEAVMLGRLRAVAVLLSARTLAPLAALAYSVYLLHAIPLPLTPTWADTGAATLFALWAVVLLSFLVVMAVSMVAAFVVYVAAERPISVLVPRR